MQTVKFIRKPFPVDAVQVTRRNMEEVAAWCQGDIQWTKPKAQSGDSARPYIKVRVLRPMGDKQTMAFEGDWVLYAGTGYKVYRDAAFHNSFERVREQDVNYVTEAGPYPNADEVDFPAVDGLIAALEPSEAKVHVSPALLASRTTAAKERVVAIETADGIVNYQY